MKKAASLVFLFAMSVVTATSAFAAEDVFAQANRLRQAILDKDETFIRSLDPTGRIVTPEGLAFLFDLGANRPIKPGAEPLNRILRTASSPPLISRHDFKGRAVYYIYWASDHSANGYLLDASGWMKTVAACALERADDGSWQFPGHLCFDETEGPFESGT